MLPQSCGVWAFWTLSKMVIEHQNIANCFALTFLPLQLWQIPRYTLSSSYSKCYLGSGASIRSSIHFPFSNSEMFSLQGYDPLKCISRELVLDCLCPPSFGSLQGVLQFSEAFRHPQNLRYVNKSINRFAVWVKLLFRSRTSSNHC